MITIKEIKNSLIILVLSSIIFGLLLLTEPYFMKLLTRIPNLTLFLTIYILWHTVKFFFLGMLLGIIAIPLTYYIIGPLLAYELIVENKLLKLRFVKLNDEPKLSKLSVFKYAYILFGPIIIVVKIVSTFTSENVIVFYLAAWEIFMKLAPYICIFLVVPYILREKCIIRELNMQYTLNYPSKLLGFIALIIIGVGSVTAQVPLFMEIYSLVGDVNLAIELFIEAILLGYMPMLSLVLGIMEVLMMRNSRYLNIVLRRMENLVEKYSNLIQLEMRNG